MIFVTSAKLFKKYKMKLVAEKDYNIIDATDDSESKLKSFQYTCTVDDFAIPSKLLHAMTEDISDFIDVDGIEELEKAFFRKERFITAVLATMNVFIMSESDINIFIVLQNKAFKYYRNKFVSEFCRAFPKANGFIMIIDDKFMLKKRSMLKESISKSDRAILEKSLRRKEEELEKIIREKNKKKKKKRKKNKGWGYTGD